MLLVRALTALSLAALLAFGGPALEGRQQKKPKKPKTVHGMVMAVQPPAPPHHAGCIVLAVKATKKQGGGIVQDKVLLAPTTTLLKHGPKKGTTVPASLADLYLGSKVQVVLHPMNPNLAVGVTVTSHPKLTIHGTAMAVEPGAILLAVKAPKKQGGGIVQDKILVAPATVFLKHGPKKGTTVLASLADVYPGSKVQVLLHAPGTNLAAGVTITSSPKLTVHGTVMAVAPDAIVLAVKATKKQGGGIVQDKFLVAPATLFFKHGPTKGTTVPGSLADVAPGEQVTIAVDPTNNQLAVSVTITSSPKKKKTNSAGG